MNTYVYGIVSAAHPASIDGVPGVGSPPATLRALRAGGLLVVVSDAPQGLRAKRRDLLAHENVLEGLCAAGATLPMRFGLLVDDDESAAHQVAENADVYAGLLAQVDNRTEINVKATYDEEEVLRKLLSEDAGLRKTNEYLRQSGGTHDERVAFGERVSQALGNQRRADADWILSKLRPFAVAESEGPEVGDSFINTSFLVDREQLDAFQSATSEIGSEFGPLLELSPRGPLPPYSFTDLAPATG